MVKSKSAVKSRKTMKAAKTLRDLAKEKGSFEILPKWWREDFLGPFNARMASVFVLHGDINGLTPNPDIAEDGEYSYLELSNFLSTCIDRTNPMTIFYDIANGIRCPSKEMKEKFMELAGLKDSTEQTAPANPVEAAKAKLTSKKQIPREPELCLPLIEKVLRKQAKTVVVISSANFIFPVAGNGFLPPNERVNIERLKNWTSDDEIRKNRAIIILIANQLADLSNEIRRAGVGVVPVFIPRPGSDERRTFIETSLADNSELKLGCSVKEFTIATQGLNLSQIRDIFLRATSDNKKVDLGYIKRKKNEILNEEHGDILEVVDAEHSLDGIGGMEYIKSELREIVKAIKVGDTKRIPSGITLMGPPGTGKTAVVEGFAMEAEYNFVKIKNLRSKWVGESESKSEKLKTALLSLAPVVVMNDESDLGGMNRDDPKGDSGVSERLMRDWMTLLSDPKIVGKILVINCTNRIDRMDAALKRSGRSDERWLLSMPGIEERIKIFEVMFEKLEKIATCIKDFKPFAVTVGDISGADIRAIVKKSYKVAMREGAKEVDSPHLAAAIDDFIPNASQKEIDLMHLLGIIESSSCKMLPSNTLDLILGAVRRNLVADIGLLIDRIRETNRIKEGKFIPNLEEELKKLAEGR